jgi:proline dehydrogenase
VDGGERGDGTVRAPEPPGGEIALLDRRLGESVIPPVARRFVAGETSAEAIEHARRTNEEGVKVVLNLLGEHYDDPGPADAAARAYVRLLGELSGVDACVSVKPTQLGLGVSERRFRENLRRVVAAGAEHDRFVWIDMEDATTTDATLDAFEAVAREFDGGVGVCVQANLRRTREDVVRLTDLPGKVRLVKGAYEEDPDVSYRGRARVDESYREVLRLLFERFDDGVAVGSHDPAMIDLARELHAEHGTGYEVQMLMGVREAAQRRLAAEGVDVWQYAPYGPQWFAYFARRVRERRENLLFALRAVLGV